MKVYNQGVLDSSDVYFHTTSAQAKAMYFYPLCTGHYHCDGTYHVSRQSYNSFLIIYVQSGHGYVNYEGKSLPLREGSLAFIDCYHPHTYYTTTGWEIYWVHFDGVLARKYYDTVAQESPIVTPPNPYHARRSLEKLYGLYLERGKTSDASLSKLLTDLLTELVLAREALSAPQGQASIIEDALTFISKNVDQPITLDALAKRASLSPFYFTRVFKKETGFTPHEYIIHMRVNLARFLLKTTDAPIKEIAFRSGFGSECSFCTTFKKATGLTPKSYREAEDL